jgi:peptidoglycan/xylan/chitin deacetylase (PgdA/CDA1 family)
VISARSVRAGLRYGSGGVAVAAAAHYVPSVATIPALRRRLLPRLSGASQAAHVALTFDDGPDPESTCAVLAELERLDVRATFFLLGTQLAAHPGAARRIVAEGHEVAVHAWRHVPHLLQDPVTVQRDVARTYAAIVDTTGEHPAYWRPPNGILSGAGFVAARRHGLRPVLWTVDGQDWRGDATAESVAGRVLTGLRAGATVLLHDSDITSAPGSWHASVGAIDPIVTACRARGWAVGPLREHWPA